MPAMLYCSVISAQEASHSKCPEQDSIIKEQNCTNHLIQTGFTLSHVQLGEELTTKLLGGVHGCIIQSALQELQVCGYCRFAGFPRLQ